MIKTILVTNFHRPQKPSSMKFSQKYLYVVTQVYQASCQKETEAPEGQDHHGSQGSEYITAHTPGLCAHQIKPATKHPKVRTTNTLPGCS